MFCPSLHSHLISHTKKFAIHESKYTTLLPLTLHWWLWVQFYHGNKIVIVKIQIFVSHCYRFENQYEIFSCTDGLVVCVSLKKCRTAVDTFIFDLSVLRIIKEVLLNASFYLILSLMKRGFEWVCSLAYCNQCCPLRHPRWCSTHTHYLLLSAETSLKNLITDFN